MIQLEIEGIFVDLYDNDPIRLNFNIEDLTDVWASCSDWIVG